jgi:hypothetical protein
MPLAGQNAKGGHVDYTQARSSIQKVESAILAAINTTFNNPLALFVKPKGAYLQGYGYTFSFLVNIRWGLIHSPMGAFKSDSDLSADERKQRIAELRDSLVKVLFYLGNGMALLEKGEVVTVTAFFEETNLDVGTVSKTVILSVLKSDLDELGTRQERFNDFKQRVKIVEY